MTGKTPAERLKSARLANGYETVMAAAQAMGANYSTYSAHENGEKGLSRAAPRYARFFRVSLDWLLTGRGEMRGGAEQPIPVMGVVTAGMGAVPAEAEAGLLGDIAPPRGDEVQAFRVEGESMYPRFQHGELVLIEAAPCPFSRVMNRYALVQMEDGRRLLKIVRPSPRPGCITLESHNAPPEHDVRPLGLWAWRGLLPGG